MAISLEFIGEQLERVLRQQGMMRDEMAAVRADVGAMREELTATRRVLIDAIVALEMRLARVEGAH